MDNIDKELLQKVADLHSIPQGAYNIRKNGQILARNCVDGIEITSKTDKTGIDVSVASHIQNQSIHIPVIVTESDMHDDVYNDFHIGEGADITIVAGCGIHNSGSQESEHSGIHAFYVGKNARVKYIEKHYGDGDGNGKNIMNPTTVVNIEEGGYMEMETAQIKGVDSTNRTTTARLADRATLIIHEKIMTHGTQFAETHFEVDLDGVDCGTHVVSRSVAKDDSKQLYCSNVRGNNRCSGHTECDAIIMDNASVSAIPEISANHVDASLIHEAAIGKIAGEQLIKLMTLGLTEKEAEEEIINGFLK